MSPALASEPRSPIDDIIDLYAKHLDLTLIDENLKLEPSTRVEWMADFVQLLYALRGEGSGLRSRYCELVATLAREGVEFVLAENLSEGVHRLAEIPTKVDVLCNGTPENRARIAAMLRPYHPRLRGSIESWEGWTESAPGATDFTKLMTDLGAVDLFFAVPGIGEFEQALSCSTQTKLLGVPCRILSVDGLIKAKHASGRPQDPEALAELEAIRERQAKT